MVRNYKKKNVYKTVKPEVRDAAITAVKAKLMSIRSAAEQFGIPRATLSDWVNGKVRHLPV